LSERATSQRTFGRRAACASALRTIGPIASNLLIWVEAF
jgi:hypothetical protein